MTDKGRALFGLAPDSQLDDETLISRVHPEDRAARATAMKHALETHGEYATEYRVLLPDGTRRWIAARGHCMKVGKAKGVRLLGVSMDVTAQKEAQDALRESEARFRTTANAAPVMIWMAGRTSSAPFSTKVGSTLPAVHWNGSLAMGGQKAFTAKILIAVLKSILTPLTPGSPLRWNTACDEMTVNIAWVLDNGTPRFAPDGAFLGYIGSCIDITERKQEQDRFRLVVESSPNGIILVDPQGHVVLMNARAEELFDYSREELIGQNVELLVPERFRDDHPALRAALHAAPEARIIGSDLELFARRKNGAEFPVEIGISTILSPEGMLILSVIVDISARKQAEAEIRQHREELAHLGRVAIMGEIAGSLAHELNQPLTGIVNNASAGRRFIAKRRADLPKLDELFEAIVADGRRAGEIIRGIRGMVRKSEQVRSPVNLNEVIASVLRFVSSDAVAHHCTLITQAESGYH